MTKLKDGRLLSKTRRSSTIQSATNDRNAMAGSGSLFRALASICRLSRDPKLLSDLIKRVLSMHLRRRVEDLVIQSGDIVLSTARRMLQQKELDEQ
jgi:hypothetical protein